jgi:hypothetical protein
MCGRRLSSTRSQWISSEQTIRSWRRQKSARAASSHRGPGASDRIVRMAEQEQACLRRDLRLHAREIPAPAAVGQAQRHLDQRPPGKLRRREERRIDRGGRNHTAFDRPAGRVDAGDQPGKPHQPFGFNLPAVPTLQVAEDGIDQRRPRFAVAETALRDTPLERGNDGRRRGEIHVGHPQRQDVAPGILAPLERVATAAVDHVSKSKCHGHLCGTRSNLQVRVELGRQIALAERRDDDHVSLPAFSGRLGHLQRGPDGGAGGNAASIPSSVAIAGRRRKASSL